LDNHIRFFEPDAIVYCVDNNARKVMTNMVSVRQQSRSADTPFFALGTREECDECMRMGVNVISHTIIKPISAAGIRDQIKNYLDKLHEAEQRELRRLEKIEQEEKEAMKKLMSEEEEQNKKQILLVDDDVAMLKTMKAFLEDDYKVATAVSGLVALRYLEKKTADLIFLDYEMPGLNGPDFLAKIRKEPRLADIPVIFLTGASERDKISNALSMKPQGYLLKPVSRDQLVEQAHHILD
jgi:CheY-like chemotaxis protein